MICVKKLSDQYLFLKEVDSCVKKCAIFNLKDLYKDFLASSSIFIDYYKPNIFCYTIKVK